MSEPIFDGHLIKLSSRFCSIFFIVCILSLIVGDFELKTIFSYIEPLKVRNWHHLYVALETNEYNFILCIHFKKWEQINTILFYFKMRILSKIVFIATALLSTLSCVQRMVRKDRCSELGKKEETVTNEHMNGFLRLISDLLIKRLDLRRAVINEGPLTHTDSWAQAPKVNRLSRM